MALYVSAAEEDPNAIQTMELTLQLLDITSHFQQNPDMSLLLDQVRNVTKYIQVTWNTWVGWTTTKSVLTLVEDFTEVWKTWSEIDFRKIDENKYDVAGGLVKFLKRAASSMNGEKLIIEVLSDLMTVKAEAEKLVTCAAYVEKLPKKFGLMLHGGSHHLTFSK